MPNLQQKGVAWLTGRLQANAAVPAYFVRGSNFVLINKVTLGNQLLKTTDNQGNVKTERTEKDFIVAANLLTFDLGLTFVLPQRGDYWLLDLGAGLKRYDVMPVGNEAPWRYADPFETLVRMHTKFSGAGALPLPAPSNLAVTSAAGSIDLTWGAVAGAATYDVWRATVSGSEALFVTIATSSYVDQSCVPGTTYYYEVAASAAGGQNPKSTERSSTVPPGDFPGTLTNAPTYAADVPTAISTFRNSLAFVGASTEYVACGGVVANDLNQFSLCVRFKTTDSTHLTIMAARAANSHQAWALYNNSGSIGFVPNTAAGANVTGVNSAGGFADGNWHDAIVVIDGIYQTLKLYLDGALAATGGAWSGTWNSSDVGSILTWAEKNITSPIPFTGSLSDCRIYAELLGAADIAAYHAGTPVSTAPVCWYKMNENTGSTALDSGVSWFTGNIVFDGNSLTTGAHIDDSNQFYPTRLAAMMPLFTGNDMAVAGQTTEAMVTRYPGSVSVLYNGAASRNVIVAWEGINSLTRGFDGISIPDTPAQAYATMASYITLAHATGFKVLLLTMIKCDPAIVSEANRLAYNALVLANSAGADRVFDMGSVAGLQDPTDTLIYYSDRIHLLAPGAAIVARNVMQQLVLM